MNLWICFLFEQIITTLDQKFCAWARKHENYSGACIVAVFILDHSHAFIANCGDCRAVLVEQDNARPLSKDHKATDPGEQKRIEAADGQIINGRLSGVLEPSRAIGDIDLKTKEMKHQLISIPEVQHIRLRPEQYLVLATDGVWDVLSNEQIATQINELQHVRMPLSDFRQQVARNITEYAMVPENTDDISLVVIECS